MNDRPDLEPAITDWLHAHATTAGSDRVLTGALARVAAVDQEGMPLRRLGFPAPAIFTTLVAALVVLGFVVIVRLSPPDSQMSAGGAASSPTPRLDVADLSSAAMIEVPLRGATLWFAPPDPALFGGWETELKDDLYISKSIVGPQGAEAMILFTSLPPANAVRTCLLDPASGSIDALADAVATAPGTELVTGPSPATLQSRRTMHVSVTVVEPWWAADDHVIADWAPGCSPAYFLAWEPDLGGAFWLETMPGDTIDVWIADVNGTPVLIQAIVSGRVGGVTLDRVVREIQGVVDTIRFDEP